MATTNIVCSLLLIGVSFTNAFGPNKGGGGGDDPSEVCMSE